MLVAFVLSVAALVVAAMAFGRVKTAYDMADAAANRAKAVQDGLDGKLAAANMQAANFAKAETGALKGDLTVKIGDLNARIEDVRADLSKLPTGTEVKDIVNKHVSAAFASLPQPDKALESIRQLASKLAALEARLASVGAAPAAATDTELRAKVEALENQFRRWMEVILPPEAITQPE